MNTPKEMRSAKSWLDCQVAPLPKVGGAVYTITVEDIEAIQADALEWCMCHVAHIKQKHDELTKGRSKKSPQG